MKTGIELITEKRELLRTGNQEAAKDMGIIVAEAARKSLYATDTNPNIITQLVCAGALIAAEIDRLQNS